MELSHPSHSSLPPPTPQVTLLIENPRKSTNWGPLLRCCAAFGIAQIFVIGYDICSVQGSHGASKHVELVAFHSMEAAVATLKELGFHLLGLLQGVPDAFTPQPVRKVVLSKGIEMVQVQTLSPNQLNAENQSSSSSSTLDKFPFSVPLHQRPFARNTCLVVGKRASGLPLGLAQVCDSLVHIPTFGQLAGTTTCSSTWLTMEASVSIVLHEFALWAGYGTHNHAYQGQKYHVQPKQRGKQYEKQEQRKAQRELDSNMEEPPLGILFDSDATGDY